MTNKSKKELAITIGNQLVTFNNMVYGCDRDVDEKMKVALNRIFDIIKTSEKHELDDFDLLVFLTYRIGKLRSKNMRIKKLEPVTLLEAIDKGFKLPKETTLVKLELKAQLKKDYNVRVVQEPIYEIKFGIGNEQNLTDEQLKRRYGLTPEENLFSIEDLEEGKMFKFFNSKHKAKTTGLGV